MFSGNIWLPRHLHISSSDIYLTLFWSGAEDIKVSKTDRVPVFKKPTYLEGKQDINQVIIQVTICISFLLLSEEITISSTA